MTRLTFVRQTIYGRYNQGKFGAVPPHSLSKRQAPGLWILPYFCKSMEDVTIYAASSVPGAASHPTLNCLQWTGDGQLLFSTKSSVYILVSQAFRYPSLSVLGVTIVLRHLILD